MMNFEVTDFHLLTVRECFFRVKSSLGADRDPD